MSAWYPFPFPSSVSSTDEHLPKHEKIKRTEFKVLTTNGQKGTCQIFINIILSIFHLCHVKILVPTQITLGGLAVCPFGSHKFSSECLA